MGETHTLFQKTKKKEKKKKKKKTKSVQPDSTKPRYLSVTVNGIEHLQDWYVRGLLRQSEREVWTEYDDQLDKYICSPNGKDWLTILRHQGKWYITHQKESGLNRLIAKKCDDIRDPRGEYEALYGQQNYT